MFARFFIDRPIFATVLSVVIVILGLVALVRLPIAQYPEVAPPTIRVTAVYPGANARVVAETVATPIETEVNGVENMLYMNSRSTNDGTMTLDITFALGTDLDTAHVLVQNRVAIAEPKLPEEARRQGITTKKQSPNILLAVSLISPDGSHDNLYLSNFATLQIKDALSRIPGVGDVTLLGAREYSMRVWLDPDQLSIRNLSAGDVIRALREQNVQVAAGRLGQPPTAAGLDFQLTLNTLGRLVDTDQYNEIVVQTGAEGQIVRLRDVARLELGAKSYDVSCFLDGGPSVGLVIYQRPGTNSLATAEAIRAEMQRLKKDFPAGVDYGIVYDTTTFIEESVRSVYHTLFEAFVLVFIVVLLFLQDWRATILPMIDVPVSLVGTLAVMALCGFTLNNLTLFGLVLAIGIVVDDAIVVLENVERWMATGLDARSATLNAMNEVTGPIIAITLVLCSVFIPTAFVAGISGQFYRQFALTIAASTVISALNAMTMTPSRAVQIFKHRPTGHAANEALPPWGFAILGALAAIWLAEHRVVALVGGPGAGPNFEIGRLTIDGRLWLVRALLVAAGGWVGWRISGSANRALAVFFRAFNRAFEAVTNVYGFVVGRLVRIAGAGLVAYAALMLLTWLGFRSVPVGFIPEQDKGYLVVLAQLPDGSSLERTVAVMARAAEISAEVPGVAHTVSVPGFSLLTGANQSNAATMFLPLKPFEERVGNPEQSGPALLDELRRRFAQIEEGAVFAFGAPPVEGLGNTGGFKLQLEDRRALGLETLQGAVENLMEKGNAQPGLVGLFSTFRVNEPQLFLEIDRTKAKSAGVALNDVFETLEGYLGSVYVNDFTLFGRNWQVNVQADARFRVQREDLGRLKVRSAAGTMVPLDALLVSRDVTGPALVSHYQMYPSADVNGSLLPGTTSGEAISIMNQLAERELPQGMHIEWTELSFQQLEAEKDLLTKLVFPLGVIFVFLVLAAQFESWTLPLAIILIVPMCLSAAICGIWLMKLDNNVFTQIGLVVLIALASKNAILIVEFARQLQNQGRSRCEAVDEACRLRLRPIVMTSLAFILGVVPLVRASGAGAEMRQALGIAVFSGMLGVTLFGLFFTPMFYVIVNWTMQKCLPPKATRTAASEPVEPTAH
ncbi:MAG TPA: efflux RND transporter permease subunit [Pirellulales bacterium]|nr:efflux RND transporter permease subunit [Pirellulales bacterium]